ncbi:MAG: 2-methylcitrate dehydratase [Proteobacteria bacterium]|nr:2-methylcitrate dehydratase [Pseudomonadota bacterium]RZO99096.1 MAG: bifunctional 2-methylcitrate dehydratase/aconitate hydratase [Gammaproteobacteria bacterium]|tara:strand:- start:9483 stop:10922 length:1440 start_codon:yes stop_codon:yes gene_type:complete
MSSTVETNVRPDPDELIQKIADYVHDYKITNDQAISTAKYCLMDTIGCGLLALTFPECKSLLGPHIDGTEVPNGVRVLGTNFKLDPIKAAWDNGAIIRWLDFNDTWLAAEWGHPSDNLGGILSACDYISQNFPEKDISVRDIIFSMIKAHEIQGVLALENSFNRVGLDHVLLVKIASVGVISVILGLTKDQTIDALSQAFVDGQSLRTYRHAPNAGPRKSWAAGDATSRAMQLVWLTKKGQIGYPSAISAPTWGFKDVLFNGKDLILNQEFESYVMENVLFKISFPAEFHAQTAVEAAVTLHSEVKNKFDEIDKIKIITHESAIRIISKEGKLNNPADRDHCLQYMTAIGLIKGDLVAEDYEDSVANDPLVDNLREKMVIEEDLSFSKDYLDPSKRSIANSLQIFYKDGTRSDLEEVHYPIGHKNRRAEGIPILVSKFEKNLKTQFSDDRVKDIMSLFEDNEKLFNLPVSKFVDFFVKN